MVMEMIMVMVEMIMSVETVLHPHSRATRHAHSKATRHAHSKPTSEGMSATTVAGSCN
jgi:hypothetical protein